MSVAWSCSVGHGPWQWRRRHTPRLSDEADPDWQANGTVRSEVISGNIVYIGGQFTAMLPAGIDRRQAP